MVDFGVDAFWLTPDPGVLPEPFPPEPGELWSKEDIDLWIDTLERIVEEAYSEPEHVRRAPHNQATAQIVGDGLNDPGTWATTWAAARRKKRV
jgi:glycine dehydrogenase subunit 2